MTDTEYLAHKHVNILVTNVCNLACGGCNQHCGLFRKPWNIEPAVFADHVSMLKPYAQSWRIQMIGVLGGEPTVHPAWEELLAIMRANSDVDFMVYSNGRSHPELIAKLPPGEPPVLRHREGNLLWRIDPKSHELPHRQFNPTLAAPADLSPHSDPLHYWQLAKRNCSVWRGAGTSIHAGRAYFCEVAGAFDLLDGGDHGWTIESDHHPFHRTRAELESQAANFCRRCNFCLGNQYQQSTANPPLVTISNYHAIPENRRHRVHLTGQKWTFGITTDGTAPERLRKIVDSIAANQIDPESHEVLVCGGDPVEGARHIPFDDTTRPGWITRKKNLLAQQARFPLLCLIHDYLVFDHDWYACFLEFGTDWDVCMSQIINTDGTRFRDWVTWAERTKPTGPRPIKFVPYDFHGLTNQMYVSGAYLCVQRSFFLHNPLDERLCWGQEEDVEWSKRVRDSWKYRCNQNSIVRSLKYKQLDITPLRLITHL